MADPDGNAYGPFDVEVPGSYSEEFSEAAWYRWNTASGVLSGGALTFDGLTAQLAAINARVRGSWFSRDATWEDASPPTTTPSPRRDLMVLRRTLTVGEGDSAIPGKTVPLVLRGAPAATPADPVFSVDTDEPLWSWQVPGSGGTAVTGIKDRRRWRGDTDWVNIPLTAPWASSTAAGSPGAKYRLRGGYAQLTFRLTRTTAWAAGSQVFKLPEYAVPDQAIYVRLTKDATDGVADGLLTISPTGVATINIAGPAGNSIYASDLYLLE